MTTVKPATAEQRAEWIHTASHIDDAEFSEAIFAYEAALVTLESELAALKAEYVPNPARNKGEKFMEYATRVGCPPTGAMATNKAPSWTFAIKAEATIETLTKDLMEARQEADNASARHMGTTRTLDLLRGDIATALGGVYGTPGFDCIAELTAKVTQLVTGLTAEKKRSNEMHRRAQASEGADERLARVRKGYAEELRYFIDRGHAWRATWKNRYREAAAQLVAAGVPDDWVSPCGLKGRTGILSELISRLVSQRDDARAAAQVQADEMTRMKDTLRAQLKDLIAIQIAVAADNRNTLVSDVQRVASERDAAVTRANELQAQVNVTYDDWIAGEDAQDKRHADEIARIKAEHASALATLQEKAAINGDAFEVEIARMTAEHAAEKERMAPAFRDRLETLQVNAHLMSEAAQVRAALGVSVDFHIDELVVTIRQMRTENADAERMTAELQRAHEAGERLQSEVVAERESRDGVRKLLEIANRRHEADLAAAVKRAEEAGRERDENLLKSGDITCLEANKPGCGMCHMCLRAAHAATAAKLGRAVAALESIRANMVDETPANRDWIAATKLTIADAADADSAAAGEAFRALVTKAEMADAFDAVLAETRTEFALNKHARGWCKHFEDEITARVDARRGGGR